MTEAGISNILGTLTVKPEEVRQAGIEVFQPELADRVVEPGYSILDVRRPDEWAVGMVDGTVTAYELSRLAKNPKSLNKKFKYIIHCTHGIRSMMAYTILKRAGIPCKAYNGTWEDIKNSGITIRKL